MFDMHLMTPLHDLKATEKNNNTDCDNSTENCILDQ